jgi:hypothetical protein
MFLVVFCFFPNQPAARLAPQELLEVFFYSVLLYLLARAYFTNQGGLTQNWRDGLLTFLLFFGLLGSKETSIALGALVLLGLAALGFRRKFFALEITPFLVLYAVVTLRVLNLSTGGGYGTAPITPDLISRNLIFLAYVLLQISAFPAATTILLLLPTLLLLSWPVRLLLTRFHPRAGAAQGQTGPWYAQKEAMFCVYLGISFLGQFAITLTSAVRALRYTYPLVFLMALGLALCCLPLRQARPWLQKAISPLLVLVFLWWIGLTYYNFVFQYAVQSYQRRNEQHLLAQTRQLLQNGNTVYAVPETEYGMKIREYFHNFRPFFYNEQYPGMVFVEAAHILDPGVYVISRSPMPLHGQQPVGSFEVEPLPAGLKPYRDFSQWAACGNEQFPWPDIGTAPLGQSNWYIWKNAPTQGSQAGGDPYAQQLLFAVSALPEAAGPRVEIPSAAIVPGYLMNRTSFQANIIK